VKSTVRQIESEDGVLIFDATLEEKKWTDENDIICWHYDHVVGSTVKGIHLLNALYHSRDVSISVAFSVATKLLLYCDVNIRQVKRASAITKNERMHDIIGVCVVNQLKFRYILMDSWYAAQENFQLIVKKKK
jgi:hypothetical protein